MGVQILPEGQGGFASSFGNALGQGISQQLPEEIKRYRLKSGLEGLEGKSPSEKLSHLISAGYTPEVATTLLPFIQQQQGLENFKNKGKKLEEKENGPISLGGEKPLSLSSPSSQQKQSKFASPEEIERHKGKFVQEPSLSNIHDRARQLISEGRAYSEKDATDLAKQELQTEVGSQNTKREKLRNELNERTKQSVQSSGLNDYGKIAGDIQKRILDQAEYDVFEKGKTQESASAEADKRILELAKALNQTKKSGALSFSPGRSQKQKESEIRAQKNIFDEYGFEEEFEDLVSSQVGVTPMKSADILDPVKNEKLNKSLDKYSHSKFHKFARGSFRPKKIGDSEMEKIVSEIKDEDNILSIEYKLREKRIDISEFREKLLEPQHYERLTDKQRRQFNKPASNSPLDDLVFKWF